MNETQPKNAAQEFLNNFESALKSNDLNAVTALFNEECYWRDLVAFTWNIKTLESRDEVRNMLSHQLASIGPSNFKLTANEQVTKADGVTLAWFDFETRTGLGYGLVRLKDAKVWTLLTTLTQLKGFEEPTYFNRTLGAKHGVAKHRTTWKEDREHELATLGYEKQPYCIIIGGGQGGIGLGARLRQLNVPTIIIERNAKPGDSWRKRYKSLCLHDPIWYDHLPYLKFPTNWPVFSPKDKIGDWLEMYTKIMELNYWGNTECTRAHYNEQTAEWEVEVVREGKPVTLRPKQLVFATGMSGKPNIPHIEGQQDFKGDIEHSSEHTGPENYTGKKAVVIGSNNSAHDIAAALWENDVDVTMVQRSSTHIVRSDTLMEMGLGPLYSEHAVQSGITTEKADLLSASLPYRIMHTFQIPVYEAIKERDAGFYQGLEKAGFILDWGDDGSGLSMKYLRRGSGYYIDVGASDLVINGEIKLAHGQITKLTQGKVVLDDGTALDADLVVFATGYKSMNGWVADLIDQQTADKIGKVWGLGSHTTKDPGPWEGEQRNMWKPTQVDSLWLHGGNLHQSRHYSQYLAMQIKARQQGLPTPVYGLQPVHHLD